MKKIMILGAVVILAAACVTQKSRSDISPTKKFYHDLTSEFNGYFNAGELYDAAVLTLEEQHSDNYNKVLPIYAYSAVDNPQSVTPDMDEAIKKVTVIRALHEPSHWIDDCYLMAGKAQFLKQDYEAAEETLRFLVDEFSPSAKLKKSRSKKKKTSSSKPVSTAQKKAQEREREQVQKEREDEREEKAQTREEERKQKEKERKVAKKQKEKEYKQRKKDRARELKERKKARKRGESLPSRRKTEVVNENAETETETATKKSENRDADRDAIREAKKAEDEAAREVDEAAKAKEDQAKRAKEIAKEEQDRPFKHRSAHQEGQLWLARTLIERDKFDQAKYLIEGLERNENLYKDVSKELAVIKAHYFIQQKEFDQAITPLETAKGTVNNRSEKARYAYILAQIYQQKNQPGQAKAYFEEVVKLKPSYEMMFSARMSMTLSDYTNGTASSKSAIKSLEKMLKDEKNVDYKDRIYFAMSEIYLKDGQEEKGIEYLKKALEEGGGNESQKAEALVKLAYIFYNEEDYVKAVEYFGEALTLLPKTDERYDDIEKLNKTISDIAANIKMIELQDSLLRISRMSNDEKRAIAYEIRQQQLKEQRERVNQVNNRNSKYSTPGAAPTVSNSAGATNSNFFAYDDRAVKRGKRSFEKSWGTGRVLEDNWRRSNRQSTSDGIENEESDNASNRLSDEEVATILRGVPQSKKQVEGTENTLSDALFELGSLYRDRLQNYKKSIATFETLLERFPDYSNKAEALYYLYLSHNDLNNTSQANQYRDQIIQDFPDSVYGQLLTDPNYLAKLNAKEMRLTNFYNSIYANFTADNYKTAFDSLQVVDARFGENNPLQARFALLDAMTRGKLEGKEAYVKTLKDVVAKFPNTDEQRRAREILRLLGTNVSTIPGGEATTGEVYKYEPDKLHYLVIVLNASAVLNDVKINVSDYNRKYHSQDKLRISNIYLDNPSGEGERTPLVVVRRFKTADDVMKYYDGVQRNKKDFIQSASYEMYPITQTNYREVLRNKNLSDYKPFFEEMYLKK